MDGRRDRLDLLAVALIVGLCALWGLNQVVVKATLDSVPPFAQSAIRSLLAAALVAAYARRRGVVLLQRDGTAPAGILAGVLFAIEFCFLYPGLRYTTASRMVVFLYMAPFVVAAGMPFVSRAERLGPTQVLGLAAAFGSLLYAFEEGLSAPASGQLLGDAMALAAAAFWGLTTIALRATSLSRAAPERTLFYQLAVSAPILGAASLIAGEPARISLDAPALASLAFQAVVVAFASYLGWFWLLRHYPATRLASFTFLTPVFGTIAGTLLMGDEVTARLALALAGIAIGIWLVNR
jgi:drug/metabolite transporter (DMT)-like permease